MKTTVATLLKVILISVIFNFGLSQAFAASHGERTRGLVVPRRRRAVVLSES